MGGKLYGGAHAVADSAGIFLKKIPRQACREMPGGGMPVMRRRGGDVSEIHQFHLKDQPGIGRDHAVARALFAVGQVRRNDEGAFFPLFHLA